MRPSDAVLIEICNSVFGSAILGILVSGSFVTDTYDPSSSDIDLISVAEIPRSDRFMGVTQGIRVDVYTGIQADLERAFRRDARDNNSVLYSFVRGRSLYDPQGIISHLKNLAAQIWHDGPASPDMEEEKNLQIAMQKALVNADRLSLRAARSAEWREMAHIYSSKLLLECIFVYCRIHKLWASAMWEMLKWDDPRYGDILRILRSYLANPSLESRLAGCGKSRSVVLPARFVAFCPFVTR